jgi:hypothetical protein
MSLSSSLSTPRLLLTGGLPDRVYEINGDIFCWFKLKVIASSITCIAAGNTSLSSVLSTCTESEIAVFVYRVIANDTAKRAKIVLLRWTGPRTTQKTRVESALLQKLPSIFKASLIVDIEESTTEDELNKRFLDSCGAFKPSSFEWGSGSTLESFSDSSPLLPLIALKVSSSSSGPSFVVERPLSPSKIRIPTDMIVGVSELRIRTPPIDEKEDGATLTVSTGAASPVIAESPLVVLTPDFSSSAS